MALKYSSTKDLDVSTHIVEQVIGQEEAVGRRKPLHSGDTYF